AVRFDGRGRQARDRRVRDHGRARRQVGAVVQGQQGVAGRVGERYLAVDVGQRARAVRGPADEHVRVGRARAGEEVQGTLGRQDVHEVGAVAGQEVGAVLEGTRILDGDLVAAVAGPDAQRVDADDGAGRRRPEDGGRR